MAGAIPPQGWRPDPPKRPKVKVPPKREAKSAPPATRPPAAPRPSRREPASTSPRQLVVLSYGLGADSTAILLRWLHEPRSRDFQLDDLVVVTAMLGNEFPSTIRQVTEHVLPLLRKHGVRYIQVSRRGPEERDGIVIHEDSRHPTRLYAEGAWKLSDELLLAGTVPQFREGQRQCSQKHKGSVLDKLIGQLTEGRPFRHVIGFNAEEMRRVERDKGYSSAVRGSEYPLVEWGWGREQLLDYIERRTGERWLKSCCVFCPFAGSTAQEKQDTLVERYQSEPEAAMLALEVEHRSLCLNPRQTLYSGVAMRDLVRRRLPLIERRFEAYLARKKSWALYRVQRAVQGPADAVRNLAVEATGTHQEMERELARLARRNRLRVEVEADVPRAYTRHRQDGFPTTEDQWVIGPAGIKEKVNRSFEVYWQRAMEADDLRARGKGLDPERRALDWLRGWIKARRPECFSKTALLQAGKTDGIPQKEAAEAMDRARERGWISQGAGRTPLCPAAGHLAGLLPRHFDEEELPA